MSKAFDRTIVIKLGGAALQDAAVIESVARQLRRLAEQDLRIVVVHGGGPAINEELSRRGIEWQFIDGQRVTTAPMIEVIDMVLCGKVNRQIVECFLRHGLRAVGFSGVDGATLRCDLADPRLDRVGAVRSVTTDLIESVLALPVNEFSLSIPVIAPIGVLDNGLRVNINADWAAAQIAVALHADKLIFLTDQDGIWDANSKTLNRTGPAALSDLIKNEVVKGGMLTKTRAVLAALGAGIAQVVIANARNPKALDMILAGDEVGTRCAADYPTLSMTETTSGQWKEFGL